MLAMDREQKQDRKGKWSVRGHGEGDPVFFADNGVAQLCICDLSSTLQLSSPSSTSTAATVSSSLQTMTTTTPAYKGKITHRSWAQLPPEIIRLVTTHYILDVCSANYLPRSWDPRDMWHPRLVYTILRDAIDIEKLMCICPAWGTALETHLFWQQACAVIDPAAKLAYMGVQPAQTTAGSTAPVITRFTPYRHFRNITSCSCVVCRINDPFRNTGLGTAKRHFGSSYLNTICVCKDHRKETFCGLCLREAPPLENESDYHAVLCVENDDVDTWPGIFTTCRSCREEWLWRRVACNPKEREAIGGHKWNSDDWETRQTVDSFIEMGEGAIQDVINVALDKHWLRKNTKLPDMLEQAMASTRYTNREQSGYSSEDELSDLDDEDDPELLSLTEDSGGVKDLALNDWARNRLLDGYWTSPADQWYGYTVRGLPTAVSAIHPTPWNRDATYEGAMEDSQGGEILDHPRPCTVEADVPPSYHLCEQAFIAFQKQMRLILLPAMNNIVRRLVIECGADGVDPAMRATKMDMEDVASELREEASWYNGIDWLERRANGERERRTQIAKEDDESSSSSKSSGSHSTSPVLSTSTLGTTPSPPASVDGHDIKKDAELPASSSTRAPSVVIPISPVLESPVLLHPIPYIPVTLSRMPQYSQEAFKSVWREACAPLYHCRCSICERATMAANVAAGTIVPNQNALSPRSHYTPSPRAPPIQIKIDEAPREQRVVKAIPEEEEESVEEEEEDWEVCPVNPRKRSSQDIDDDADGDSVDEDEHTLQRRRSGSLSKRLRREEDYIKDIPVASPTRLRKRSSEELEDDDSAEDGLEAGERGPASKKRLRIDSTPSEDTEASPPVSIIGNGESDSVPTTGDEDELDFSSPRGKSSAYALHPRSLGSSTPITMSEADMAGLYTFDPPGAVISATRDGEVDV